jgi:hypothetical protein
VPEQIENIAQPVLFRTIIPEFCGRFGADPSPPPGRWFWRIIMKIGEMQLVTTELTFRSSSSAVSIAFLAGAMRLV